MCDHICQHVRYLLGNGHASIFAVGGLHHANSTGCVTTPTTDTAMKSEYS